MHGKHNQLLHIIHSLAVQSRYNSWPSTTMCFKGFIYSDSFCCYTTALKIECLFYMGRNRAGVRCLPKVRQASGRSGAEIKLGSSANAGIWVWSLLWTGEAKLASEYTSFLWVLFCFLIEIVPHSVVLTGLVFVAVLCPLLPECRASAMTHVRICILFSYEEAWISNGDLNKELDTWDKEKEDYYKKWTRETAQFVRT